MPKIIHARITKATVERLSPDQMIRDTDLVGFGARRQKTHTSYFLQKRLGAKVRWITIGRHGSPWTPESARREAYRLLGQVADGVAPMTKRQDLTARPTVNEAADAFLDEQGPRLKPSSFVNYRYLLRDYIRPALGDRLVATVTRADVIKLHNQLAKRPRLANFTVAVLSRLFSWCEERDLRPMQSNPCFGVKRFRETKRERYLSTEEFARLGAVLDAHEATEPAERYIVAAIRLLLLTGARLSEILSLTWKQVDLERGRLLLPDSKTGQKTIRLASEAIDVLADLPRLDDNPYVIPGRLAGGRLVNLHKPWQRICLVAGLDDVRIHDLRHTFASVAALEKGSLPMIGKLLGHTNSMTTARYAHLTQDPVDQLAEDVASRISKALGGDAARKRRRRHA